VWSRFPPVLLPALAWSRRCLAAGGAIGTPLHGSRAPSASPAGESSPTHRLVEPRPRGRAPTRARPSAIYPDPAVGTAGARGPIAQVAGGGRASARTGVGRAGGGRPHARAGRGSGVNPGRPITDAGWPGTRPRISPGSDGVDLTSRPSCTARPSFTGSPPGSSSSPRSWTRRLTKAVRLRVRDRRGAPLRPRLCRPDGEPDDACLAEVAWRPGMRRRTPVRAQIRPDFYSRRVTHGGGRRG
jgi:hypothetical protein